MYVCTHTYLHSFTMRIRKRLAPSSLSTAALSDLHLQRSEAALMPSDQPSDPQTQPSDQSMGIPSRNNRWDFPKYDKTEEKMKQKELEDDDETWRVETKKRTNNNDIRRIVNICDGEDANKILQPLSFSAQESWCGGDEYKTVPLKKRKGCFERNSNEERIIMSAKMKSKTNKKCGDNTMIRSADDDKKQMEEKIEIHNSSGCGHVKKSKRENVIMEGSRCSRVNGRGWRCCQPTLVGYSLCEHHLGKGRLGSMAATVRRRGGGGAAASPPPICGGDTKEQQPLMVVTKKRTKVAVVKARSMSSLLSQM